MCIKTLHVQEAMWELYYDFTVCCKTEIHIYCKSGLIVGLNELASEGYYKYMPV
jgi:hypothetical protein